VLESLTSPERLEKKPWDLFFLGAVYALLGIFLSLWVFKEQATIVMVLLTVMAAVPLMYTLLKAEEKKDLTISSEKNLLKEHSKLLLALMFLFLGFVATFSLAYIFLPVDIVEGTDETPGLFSSQEQTINEINTRAIGFNEVSGKTYANGLFLRIFGNNLKVMLFCVFFSFFYGAGAIFILTWNATVISAALGNFFRTHISSYAATVGLTSIGSYFQVYALGLLRYFIHGLPEILAYFIGGLAGGLISVAVVRHDFSTSVFGRVMKDALHLIILAVIVLVIAGVLEVYVTPVISPL